MNKLHQALEIYDNIPIMDGNEYTHIYEISLIQDLQNVIITMTVDKTFGISKQEVSVPKVIHIAKFGIWFLENINLENMFNEIIKERKQDLEQFELYYIKEFYSKSMEFFKVVKDIEEVK